MLNYTLIDLYGILGFTTCAMGGKVIWRHVIAINKIAIFIEIGDREWDLGIFHPHAVFSRHIKYKKHASIQRHLSDVHQALLTLQFSVCDSKLKHSIVYDDISLIHVIMGSALVWPINHAALKRIINLSHEKLMRNLLLKMTKALTH